MAACAKATASSAESSEIAEDLSGICDNIEELDPLTAAGKLCVVPSVPNLLHHAVSTLQLAHTWHVRIGTRKQHVCPKGTCAELERESFCDILEADNFGTQWQLWYIL